ncbi:acyltransferase [Octadecabacter sp. SW4]|uniref:lysophospholipid acyltransferase family protein n=1 Tax=Octadecabacter sp. SW4 TaxID=2602067 RepID=UPI0011C1E6ED|nr:lysophospholipid acyltransferase family protein [Octadecabacter sp. SW4]QEE35749.1 acyltransferase [Octadecabacter sp. SW4]
MTQDRSAREISYASSAATRGGRAVIRVMENTTGRLRLIRKLRGSDAEVAQGADFWQVITQRYGLDLNVIAGDLNDIPANGPLVLVANHPYGILDGLMLGWILSQRRGGDFRILANDVFCKSPDLARVILPISFDDTKAAAKLNLETRAEALRYLAAGGAIGVFPGGTVSTSARPFSRAMDPSWRTFTARMITKSGATVVPVFFAGSNSRLFQLASHIHSTLRVGMLIREFRSRMGQPVDVVIGRPVTAAALAPFCHDAKACMDFLRKATYELSPTPVAPEALGHEFDSKQRARDGGRHIR